MCKYIITFNIYLTLRRLFRGGIKQKAGTHGLTATRPLKDMKYLKSDKRLSVAEKVIGV